MHLFTLLVTFALLPAGSTDPQQPGTVPSQERVPPKASDTVRKPLDGDVRIELKVTELAGRRVRIHGSTNLPKDTILMLSIEERVRDGFRRQLQSESSVQADGSFQSEPFGPARGLEDGVYVAEVVMPIPNVQPDHVRKIIGANGENLTGPLVEASNIGTIVSAKHEFTIGGEHASQAQVERAEERARQYQGLRDEILALNKRLQAARSKNLLRDERNLTNLAQWGKFAREFQSDYEQLSSKLSDLPLAARVTFADTLNYVQLMFLATASNKPEDYKKASALYAESRKELGKFITEAGAASKPSGTNPRIETLMRMAKSLEPRNTEAAIRYYQDVIRESPETPESKAAAERIEALRKK